MQVKNFYGGLERLKSNDFPVLISRANGMGMIVKQTILRQKTNLMNDLSCFVCLLRVSRRDRERDRETEIETDRDRQTETERDRDRDRK